MKTNLFLSISLSALSLLALIAAILGATHQLIMFVIGGLVAAPMWREFINELKRQRDEL